MTPAVFYVSLSYILFVDSRFKDPVMQEGNSSLLIYF